MIEPPDGPALPIERRRPYLKMCLEVVSTDMRSNIRVVLLAGLAAVLLLIVPRLWLRPAAAQPRPGPPAPLSRVTIWPGSQALDYQTRCGGNLLASMSYWPQPADTIYRADFRAMGGGDFTLSLPLGQEAGYTNPDDGLWHHGIITVTVPYPVGEGPVSPILFLADVYCAPSVATPGGPKPRAVIHPARVIDLNVYAIAQP